MAVFNPDFPDQPIPNYLSYSKGTDKPMADTSFAELFKGVAGIVGHVTDFPIQQAAEKATKESVVPQMREITDPYVGAAYKMGSPGEVADTIGASAYKGNIDTGVNAGGDTKPVPQALQEGANTMERLQRFAAAGGSQQYVHARLDAAARELYQQFPGYQDFIDKTIEKVTGIQPANAILKDVFHDIEKGRTQSEKQKQLTETLISSNEKDLWPGVREQWQQGLITHNQISDAIIKRQSKRQNDADAIQGIALAENGSKLQKDMAGKAFRSNISGEVDQIFSDMNKGLGDIQNKIDDFQSGKGPKPGPEEIRKTMNALNLAERNAELVLRRKATSVFTDVQGNVLKDNNSFFTILGKETIDGEVASQMKRFQDLKSALTVGDYSAAKQTLTTAEVKLNNTYGDLINTDKDIAATAITRKLLGDQTMNSLYTKNQNLQDKNTASIREYVNKTTSSGVVKSMDENRQLWDRLNEKDPVTAQKYSVLDMTNDVKRNIINKDLPVEIRKNNLKAFFGDENNGFFDKMAKANRMELWTIMTSPAMTEAVKELTKDDPKLFLNYQKRALEQFNTSFTGMLDALSSTTFVTPGSSLVFDEKRGYFIKNNILPGTDPDKNVDAVNTGLINLKKILELNGGDPNEAGQILRQNLQDKGIDPTGKAGTWPVEMLKALGRKVGDALASPANASEGKDQSRMEQPQKDLPAVKQVLFDGQKVKASLARDGNYYVYKNNKYYMAH